MFYICSMKDEFIHKWASQVKKGVLSFIVLKILRHHEYYGYELMEAVKHTTNIEIAEGTLYPLMIRLHEDGMVNYKWVEQQSGIPRKYYTLTDLGEKALCDMEAYWTSLSQTIEKI
jgi:PadR family transcriptional regulator, regulatory protein PadR